MAILPSHDNKMPPYSARNVKFLCPEKVLGKLPDFRQTPSEGSRDPIPDRKPLGREHTPQPVRAIGPKTNHE